MTTPKRIPQDWEPLEQEPHAVGVSAEEIQAGARRLLAEDRGHQLAETRKQLGLAERHGRGARAQSPASPRSNTAR
jgi:hypothetical protein